MNHVDALKMVHARLGAVMREVEVDLGSVRRGRGDACGAAMAAIQRRMDDRMAVL